MVVWLMTPLILAFSPQGEKGKSVAGLLRLKERRGECTEPFSTQIEKEKGKDQPSGRGVWG